MKTSKPELQALTDAAGPRATAMEIATIEFLSKQDAYDQARDVARGQGAIDAALALLKTDVEAVRAAHWNGLPLAFRRVAVMSANMPKERANDTLNKFTALERGAINVSMQRLKGHIETLARCMQGGAMPTTEAVH